MNWTRRHFFPFSAFALCACSLFVSTSGLQNAADGSDGSQDGDGSERGDGQTEVGTNNDSGVGLTDGSIGDGGPRADAASAYATAILGDGPLAYFRLNETTGTLISSETGPYTGSFTRGVALGAPSPVTREPGNLGATFFLEGGIDDSDLSLGDNFIFSGTQPFSVEMWVTATQIDGNTRHTLSKADRNGSGPVDGWNVSLSNNPAPVVWIDRTPSGGPTVRSAEMSVSAGVLFHFVGVYDGSQLTAYVNGVAGAPVTTGGSITSNATAAFMGSANGGVTSGYGYVGLLDEVAIYDKALTPAQITAHYALGKP